MSCAGANSSDAKRETNTKKNNRGFYSTEKLIFSPVEREDLHILAGYRNKVWMYTREFRPLNAIDQERWLADISRPDTKHIMFKIEEKSSGLIVGCCGLTYIDWKNRNAEVSLYIDSAFSGKEYGFSALQFLEFYGFDVLNLNSLVAFVYECNEKSKRLFKRAEYECVGILKSFYFYKQYWDVYIFQKIRSK